MCRDFAHLAITFCRALNIPARYVFGYMPDIGVPGPFPPMDFHAWFEVYLGERWWTFDARFNTPRIGRIPIGIGRDAVDVAMVTTLRSGGLPADDRLDRRGRRRRSRRRRRRTGTRSGHGGRARRRWWSAGARIDDRRTGRIVTATMGPSVQPKPSSGWGWIAILARADWSITGRWPGRDVRWTAYLIHQHFRYDIPGRSTTCASGW